MVVVLLAASAVRFADLDRQSIWFDEGWSAFAASQPTLADAVRADLTNPPLYYLLLNIFARFFGTTAYALRWVSSAFNLITIALLYALTRRLFDRKAGVYAAAVAASAALLWWASQEARMYTMLALLVVIAAFAWQRLLERPTRAAWLALWAAELALLYSHNTGPIAAVWLNLVTLIAWVGARNFHRPNWRTWFAGQIGIFVLWLPWLRIFLNLGEANAALSSAPTLTPEFALAVWQGLVVGVWSLVVPPSPALVISILLFIVTLLVIPWREAAARWLLLHFGLLIGGVIAGLIILGNEYHGRYAVMALPLLLAAIGAGIARLRWRSLRGGVLLLFIGGFALALMLSRAPEYGNDDVRGMVRYYAETLGEGDTVLAWSYADRYDLWYYWERLGARAQRVTLPEGADMDTIVPRLPKGDGAIALNIWYTQRADYRGMLPCLLGHRTSRVPVEFTTYGMTNLTFHQHAAEVPMLISQNIPFALDNTPAARIIQSGSLPEIRADQAICVPIELQLEQPTPRALSIALIARNTLGWEVARADAIVATADQRTALAADEIARAFALIRLPYGAPGGEYAVYLRLYDPEAVPSGFVPADATLATSGRDVLLGTWRTSAPGSWDETGTAPLSQNANIVISPNLALADIGAPQGTEVRNGDRLRLSLLWRGSGAVPALTFRDDQGHWSLAIPPSAASVDGALLDWREIRVPTDAPNGDAVLTLPDGTEIARFGIRNVPALYDPPPSDAAIVADFPTLGHLVGYTLVQDTLTLTTPPEITLVWRAGDLPIQTDYTVFAQLLNQDGIVIAQSDSMPAGGERPTAGWRAGEYIVDRHRLTYNGLAQPGEVLLIVGWYDPATNRRLLLSDGRDALPLTTLNVESIP